MRNMRWILAAGLLSLLVFAGVLGAIGQDTGDAPENLCNPDNPKLIPLSEMKRERTRDNTQAVLTYTNEQGEQFVLRLRASDPKLIETAISEDKVCFDVDAFAVPVYGVFWDTLDAYLKDTDELIARNPELSLPEIIEQSGFSTGEIYDQAYKSLMATAESLLSDGIITAEALDDALKTGEVEYHNMLQPPDVEVSDDAKEDEGKIEFIFEISGYAVPDNFVVRGTKYSARELQGYDEYLHFYIDPTINLNQKRWFARPGGTGTASVNVSSAAGSVEASLRTTCNSISAIWGRDIPATQASGFKAGVGGLRIKGRQNNSRFAVSGTWTKNENSTFTAC
jgi:hypothetical protein